nr:MAG TPA: stabilization protein [Caudoviricetes sp.]
MPEVSGDLITRNYSNFRGVDFSNTEVALYRSPDAINMWKDYKKMGTSIETRPDIVLFKELKNTVYGLFFYTINQVDHMIIHCGVSLYDYNMKTKELKIIKEKGMNIRKSQSFIYRNILYIKDGLNYLQYDGETCKEVIGYIPITTIGKAPSGGGTTNQEVNLLTGVRENSFCADGESTEYVLDASELDAGYQEKVFINDVEKTEGFTVDKVSGKVKFTTAPEKPLTDGQDNVVIRFSKTIPGNRDKINKCTILEVFDNRVFFSGNQDYPNTVFHTMLDEPKYCSDLDYYNEGADISPVRGMVAGNNALWVIKEPSQANTAIFYHNPTIDSEAGKVYPSEHSSISTGCIGAAINFNDDIVYFSNRGMEGISGDITTEQVISHRSSLVDSKLLQEENYKDMILVEYEGYLLVIIKDKIYLADSRAMFTNENHNEYEWFYWDIDIEPTCAVVYNGELWLGSKQGIFKIGKASENNKEISMEKDEEERYFIDGVTKQETGAESYKTVTGKEILIEDGENNKGLEIKVKGSTNQATRSEKNLLDNTAITKISNGITFTVNSDGTVLADGTNDTTANSSLIINRYDLSPGTYVLNGCPSGGAINTYRLAIQETGSYSVLGSIDIGNGSGEFTIDTTTTVQIAIFIQKGLTINKLLFKPMLRKATIADDTYEQYGASPSPDYPAKIENVEGKNKFNKSNMTEATWDNGKTNTVTLLEDGRIQSTANYAQWAAKCIDIPNLKANTNYVVSGKIVSSTAGNAMIIVKGYKNNTLSNIIYRQYAVGTKFELSFNSSDYEKIGISLNGKNGTLGTIYTTIFDEIQLEEDIVATDYVPYNSLEIKDVGENLFNPSNAKDGYISDRIGQIIGANIKNKNTGYIKIDGEEKYFILSNKLTGNWGAWYDKDKKFISGITLGGKNKGIVTAPNNAYFINFTVSYENNNPDYANNVMIARSDKETPYKPYQEQKVTFPLENQKLMEDSYLASDGIHHKRKQTTVTIQNIVALSNGNVGGIFQFNGKKYSNNNVLCCDKAKHDPNRRFVTDTVYENQGNVVFVGDLTDTLETLKAKYDGAILEYELATEEIVPYTTEQQEAWDKKESMKLYDGINHIESTSEIDIKYNYIYKKPSIKNKSNIENKISSGEYQTIINNKRYFVFLEEELKSVRNDITDRLYIDTNKNIAKVMKRVDKLVLNGTEEWNVNATHSNVFYTAKPKNMADNETNIFCTITDEFSKDLSGEIYGILIDTNINIKIPKVKTVADLKAYLAKEPITIQYKAIEEIKDIILLSKPSSYWTTCEDEFKYPQMQKTTNKRGCVADITGEEIDIFVKTNKEQFEKIATHKNATGYAVNRIKKKKWKSIQLKFSSNKSFELFSCTLESYIGSYIKR